MLSAITRILIFFLGLGYTLYTGQFQFLVIVCGVYEISATIIRFWTHQRRIVLDLFRLFFVIYGALVLFSQIQLIKDPYEDFYVHGDASGSFYKSIMDIVLPCSWSELPNRTLYNSYFFHYPLAAFIMSAWGKFGMMMDIENLRLFFRIHVFVIGAFVIAIMTNLLKDKGLDDERIKKYIIPFGLCSYLYTSSAIFSRDIHVTFVYTMAVYVCLKDNVKYRTLLFLLLFFTATGLRPQNGIVYLVFPLAYYYPMLKKKLGVGGIFVIALAVIVVLLLLMQSLKLLQESTSNYNERSLENVGGIFYRMYTLPFPLNTMAMVVYMAFMPIPLFGRCIGEGNTWLNLPSVFSSYLIYLCFMVCLYYIVKARKKDFYFYVIVACILAYVGIIFGSPDERRAFAAIPGLYMCYCLTRGYIPEIKYKNYKKIGWLAITVIQLFFVAYVYL